MSPDLWVPGAAEPSLDDFVARVLQAIERYTVSHTAERTHVEVELGDGQRLMLRSLSREPGYGFLTLAVHRQEDDDPELLIVPVGRHQTDFARTSGRNPPPGFRPTGKEGAGIRRIGPGPGKCPPRAAVVGARSAAEQSFEDRWYVKEHG